VWFHLSGADSRTFHDLFVVTRAFQAHHMLTSRLNLNFGNSKAKLNVIFLLEFLLMKALLFEFLKFIQYRVIDTKDVKGSGDKSCLVIEIRFIEGDSNQVSQF
jgi:hypothetical protein